MANPEKLSLWDRWFNRYKRTIHKRGSETWNIFNIYGEKIPTSNYSRSYVEYLVIDRLTGSERIEKEYLN
jgi:hypothetical protein